MKHGATVDIRSYLPPPEWFGRWWDPAELLVSVRDHNEHVPSELLFTRPELKPLLEAHAAARFAAIRGQDLQCSIRLATERFPDFELRIQHQLQQFELTEADHDGRKRGDEYREAAKRKVAGLQPDVELISPDDEERDALSAIARAIERKAAKRYAPPPPHLLVYVNFSLFRELRLKRLDVLQLVEPWTGRFASIWLLWGANALRCWPNPAHIVDRDPMRGF